MSRAERRAYQRMTKNQDRYAMPANPALKARQEKQRARRAAQRESRDLSFYARYVGRSLIAALLLALLVFSLQWSNGIGPSLIAGAVAFVVVVALAVGMRFLQRRAATQR